MQSKPGGHRPLAPQLSQGSHHSISATPTAAATSPVISSSAVRHDQCHCSVRARATRTFFVLSRPPYHGNIVVFAARARMEMVAGASPTGPQRQGCKTKKLQHGAPPVGDARGYLPRRSRGTRPYRASFFGDFGTRCTSFAVRGLRKVFLRRCHQRSIVRVCSPAVLRSCPAPSSTTFRLPRQRVSSSSTIRQTKCGGGPRPPLFGGSASPRERPSSSTPPGNVSSPRCARCQRGPRRPAASSKRRPGINRRAICFFFLLLSLLSSYRTLHCLHVRRMRSR